MKKLDNLYLEWKAWATSANRDEDGWESDFPKWEELITAAIEVMQMPVKDSDLEILENCWAISEENEELMEYASEHIDQCWDVVEALIKSSNPKCRWQAVVAASEAGEQAESLLRKSLQDSDSYVRRRALLCLKKFSLPDAKTIREQMKNDPDPYVKKVALEIE